MKSTITFTNLGTGDNITIETNGKTSNLTSRVGKKRIAPEKKRSLPEPKRQRRCVVVDLTDEEPKERKKPVKKKKVVNKMLTKYSMVVELPSTNDKEVKALVSNSRVLLPLQAPRRYPKRKTPDEVRREGADLAYAKALDRRFNDELSFTLTDVRSFDSCDNDEEEEDFFSYERLLSLDSTVHVSPERTKTTIEKLTKTPWTTTMETKSCSVCLDDFNPSNSVIITDCYHTYHYDCLYEWFKVSKACPVCKHECGTPLRGASVPLLG